MRISDFDFELPEELIAQRPAEPRDASRMLVVERARNVWHDAQFSDLPARLSDGDVLVVNNTRVFPARLVGRREPSGGRVELFLIAERAPGMWAALARPARRLHAGARVSFGAGRLQGEIVEAHDDGQRIVRFSWVDDFYALLEEIGQTPLPPYIKRGDDDGDTTTSAGEGMNVGDARRHADRERYQTIYAQTRGAIAAPTAGLHFTARAFADLRARGVAVVEITLHVGYGTFAPVRVENLREHAVAPERFSISDEAAATLNEARAEGRRVVAIGTTTVRALEAATDERGRLQPGTGETGLTIIPGYRFKLVGALLTNFHLPRSSLLVLVSSFAGNELTRAAYAHAVRARYRFYSYGDCMLIV